MKWPEVLGMCIWDFSNPFEKETRSTWVHADSGMDETGYPDRATLDYDYIAALAKPTRSAACISGRFLDANTRAGIPGVQVGLNSTDARFTTDRFGNFLLEVPAGLTDSRFLVCSYASPSHGVGVRSAAVLPGGNSVLEVVLESRTFARLAGRVIDTQTGEPLEAARVSAEPGHFGTTTDHEGRFAFHRQPHGYYTITVAKDGYYPHRQFDTLLAADRLTEHEYRLGPGREPLVNLVTNAGFERAEPPARTALGWGAIGPDEALQIDGKTVYAGDQAQRIETVEGETTGIVQWTNYSSLTPGCRYRLQAWVRLDGVGGKLGQGVRLRGTVVTNPHKTLLEVQSDAALSGTSPWRLLSADFTAPPEAGRVSLQIELTARTGTAWADEAAVIPLD
jgi:hypothetical protein